MSLGRGSLSPVTVSINEVLTSQREFVQAREWEKFHTTKNLAMALGGEVGELAVELSAILDTNTMDAFVRSGVVDEVGDVTLYLLRMYDVIGCNPPDRVFSCADELPARVEIMPMTPSRQLAVLGSVCELAGTCGRILETLQWARDDAVVDQELTGTILTRLDTFGRALMTICRLVDVNPIEAALAKNIKNIKKYPVELSRGSSRKYTDLTKDAVDG